MSDTKEERQEWMQGLSRTVNPEDYLLGRKIDKTFQLAQQEKANELKEARIKLIAEDRLKLKADPILELEKKKRQMKYEIISNPSLLKRFREFLDKNEDKLDQSVRKHVLQSQSHRSLSNRLDSDSVRQSRNNHQTARSHSSIVNDHRDRHRYDHHTKDSINHRNTHRIDRPKGSDHGDRHRSRYHPEMHRSSRTDHDRRDDYHRRETDRHSHRRESDRDRAGIARHRAR